MVFRDRTDAGKKLAQRLSPYKGEDVIVYALPRGGVVVAAEVAHHLGAPLDLIIARKIPHPMFSEYAIGAVTEAGVPVWNRTELGFTTETWRSRQLQLARGEARRRRIKYQGYEPAPDVNGKIAIIVDDGIATGLTMAAAIKDIRSRKPRRIVVAVPVAATDALHWLADYADAEVALQTPGGYFGSIGEYYQEFPQVDDEEVRNLMHAYRVPAAAEQLDVLALNSLLATVKSYPVMSTELARKAKGLHSPPSVVGFFESIPASTTFHSKLEVMQRSKVAEILMEEEGWQLDENLHSYD